MTQPFGSEFTRLIQGATEVDLIALLVELAQDADASADVAECRRQIARLAAGCRAAGGADGETLQARLRAISHHLFAVEGFRGNRESYYDPRNSYLPHVLESRQGLPISLCLVYRLVARELGVETFGCNTPRHFVLGAVEPDEGPWYVDAFAGGAVLSLLECVARLRQLAGPEVEVSEANFAPAPLPVIVARVLRNLKTAHGRLADWSALLRVAQRLVSIEPDDWHEVRDLSSCYVRVGRPREALSLLVQYQSRASAPLTAEIEPYVRAARRLVIELN